MIVAVWARLQELIKLRNLEQKHQMKSLLLDIDHRLVSPICFPIILDCTPALMWCYISMAECSIMVFWCVWAPCDLATPGSPVVSKGAWQETEARWTGCEPGWTPVSQLLRISAGQPWCLHCRTVYAVFLKNVQANSAEGVFSGAIFSLQSPLLTGFTIQD